jgi:integrase
VTDLARKREANLAPVAAYLASLAGGSRRAQSSALEAIAARMGGRSLAIPWRKLDRTVTVALRAWMVERYAPATANRMLCALRGVLREAWRAGEMSDDRYHRAVDLPAVRSSRLPKGRALSESEVGRMFRAAAGPRDRSMLAILVGAGLRRAEAASLRWSDLSVETGELRVIGKGDRERTGYLGRSALAHLKSWRECCDGKASSLILNLSASGIYKRVRRISRVAGLEPVSPHDLRRTLVSSLLDAGADLLAVRDLVGHASVETTARYDRRGESAKRAAADMMEVP